MPGWLLRALREILHMIAAEMARTLGCHPRTLGRWEEPKAVCPFHAEFRPHRIYLVHDHGGFDNGLQFIIFEKGRVSGERA